MKIVRLYASVGFAGERTREIQFSDEEWEEFPLDENELYQMADEFGAECLETWYEVEDA